MALSVTDRTGLAQVLGALTAQASRLAAARGAPVLVSHRERVPWVDPIDAFSWAAELADDRGLWLRPDEGMALVSVDVAHAIEPDAPDRFAAAAAAWRDLLAGALLSGDGPGPALLGGFAFDPARPATPRWRGFPAARLVLPRLMLSLHGRDAWLTVNAVVGQDDDPAAAARQMVETWRAFMAGCPAPPAPRSQPWERGNGTTTNRSPLPELGAGPGVRAAPDWHAAVAAAAAAVRRGELEKVVLARALHVEEPAPFDLDAALRRLRDAYPTCYVFAIARGERVFLGATPERLVRLDEQGVRVASLAGSIRRGATPAEDRALGAALLASAKDRAEHAVVVRAILAALAEHCVDIQAPAEPTLLTVRNVHHLYTPVTARLRDGATLFDLVGRLHPTPAVGGMPRAAALRYIREHEGLDRGWYAAPVGWVDAAGHGEFAVALRSALVAGAEATLFAGCGIMGDSDPEREYAESAVKLRPMLAALGIEEAGTA